MNFTGHKRSEEFYNFNGVTRSILHTINFLGDDLEGAVIGLGPAQSFCTILQNCPAVKTLYGVDWWRPHKIKLDEKGHTVLAKDAELNKLLTTHNIKYSGCGDKAKIYDGDSNDIVNQFADYSLDFIFIDSYTSADMVTSELTNWYPKLKHFGLFSGHICEPMVFDKVLEFRNNERISIADDVWLWYK